jgi:hypothetical protein
MPVTARVGGVKTRGTKRQNFNITPEQEAEISWLKDAIDAPTTKDAILRAVRVVIVLAREATLGHRLYVAGEAGTMQRLLVPELDRVCQTAGSYLVARPHPWRSQLWVKGRRLLASTVWRDMLANKMSVNEAADNWSLPADAIEEITRYCKANQELISMEAEDERRRLIDAGVKVETRREIK